MIARKISPAPPTNVHDLARLQSRVLAGLGANAIELIRGGPESIGPARELLAALPVAIYTTDAEGRITFFNEAAAALWGQRPMLGSNRYCGSWRIMSADGTPIPHAQCPLAIALRTGKDVAGAERLAGDHRPLSDAVARCRRRSGRRDRHARRPDRVQDDRSGAARDRGALT